MSRLRVAATLAAVAVTASTLALAVGVDAAVPAGAVVADGFGRADAASLGVADTGQAWATWAGSARVVGQQAEAAAGGYTLAAVDTGISDGTAAVTVPTVSSEFWLVVRATTSANYWRFGRWQGGAYQLQQVASNALGSPALSVRATVTPAAGDRLSCQLGTGLACSVNGTLVVTTADGFNATAKVVGLAAAGSTATRFDDVLVTAPAAAPDLTVDVVAASSTVDTGAAVSWTASVANAGPAAATSTVATVTLPAAVSGATVSSPAGACSGTGTTRTCSLGTRAAGSTTTVAVTATAPSSPTTLTLGVSVAAAEADADPATNSDTDTVTVRAPPPAGAAVVDGFNRADGPLGAAETGQPWSTWTGAARVAAQQAEATGAAYTVAAVDTGVTAGTVSARVTTVSPELWLVVRGADNGNYWRFGRWQGGTYQLQMVRASALGSPAVTLGATITPAAGDQLSCRLGTGLSCSVNGTLVASTSDPFNATARFAGLAGGAGTATRFDDLLVVRPPPAPDLRVAVTPAADSVTVGAPVSWTATVGNDGTVSATGTTASVALTGGVTFVSVTTSAGSCSGSGANWTCALGARAVGTTATITVKGTAPLLAGTATLTVSASAAEADADPASNSATSSVAVRTAVVPGQVVRDNFTRANSSTLGTAETGEVWSTVSGGFGVTSNAAAAAGAASMATLDPGWAYGTYQVTVAAGASSGFAVVLRGRDAANHFRVGPDASGYYRLWKVRGGAVQDPQFQVVRADVRARDGDVIRIVNRPDDGIWVGVNGQHVIDGGDVDLLGERRVGLAGSSSTVRFDTLLITQVMSSGMTTVDNFGDRDGTALNFADSGTRYPWRAALGYWEHRSGRAVQASPGYGVVWTDTTSELGDAKVTVSAATGEAWLLFRYAESGDHYAFGRAAGGTYVVERVVGGQGTVVPGSQLLALPAQAGDVLDVRQFADGRVEAWVRGIRVAALTDSSFNVRATAYGLAGSQGSAFDAFSVTPE